MPTQTIESRLLAARLALNNALDNPEILAELRRFGYGEERLEEGRSLLAEAEELVDRQKVEYGEQYEATAVFKEAQQMADEVYSLTLKVARVAFKGNQKARNALVLDGRRQRSISGWVGQARTFYNNLLDQPDLLERMATFGYDQGKLEEERARLERVANLNDRQESEKGEAQEASQKRDAALDALDEWLADFTEIAEVALVASPQRLEQLGLRVAA